ncbi:DUF2514 family protein [Pseudomonas sp. RIT-To-2]|uniref:DUF2514 family protein n=1 Tax=Pseudomonas sp. RIT-To-2 TaxID=3462541 RepID=UPI002413C6B1
MNIYGRVGLGVLVFALLAAEVYGVYHHGLTVSDARWQAKWDAAEASAAESSRLIQEARQREIDQVRNDAIKQKAQDDAHAAELAAAGDSLRKQTAQLLADRAVLSARLAARGKTINDLADLLAQLRAEADEYAGELATALDGSRRAGFACEASYAALRNHP